MNLYDAQRIKLSFQLIAMEDERTFLVRPEWRKAPRATISRLGGKSVEGGISFKYCTGLGEGMLIRIIADTEVHEPTVVFPGKHLTTKSLEDAEMFTAEKTWSWAIKLEHCGMCCRQ